MLVMVASSAWVLLCACVWADMCTTCRHKPRFDVILIDPPWEEYVRRAPGFVSKDEEVWTWQQIQDLNIGAISDEPSFVFL